MASPLGVAVAEITDCRLIHLYSSLYNFFDQRLISVGSGAGGGVGEDVREEFSAFYQLMEQTRHIPILENWKNLSHKEQKDFDLQRLKSEESFRDFVQDAAVRIQGREF